MLRSAINVRVHRGSFPLELANRDWEVQSLYQSPRTGETLA
jgi:hypothetical protein